MKDNASKNNRPSVNKESSKKNRGKKMRGQESFIPMASKASKKNSSQEKNANIQAKRPKNVEGSVDKFSKSKTSQAVTTKTQKAPAKKQSQFAGGAPKNSRAENVSDALLIESTITVKASLGELWNALTDRDELENWWGEDVVLEPRIGGKFQERWEDDQRNQQVALGQVKLVKKQEQISFTWREKDWAPNAVTTCTFILKSIGLRKDQSSLTMRHSGWETLPESQRKQILKDFKVGWTYHLKELKSYLDE